jgi:hypothetical protein
VSLEIVQLQRAVAAQRSGRSSSSAFIGLDAGSHGLMAPEIQEHAGPHRRVVFPEIAENLL